MSASVFERAAYRVRQPPEARGPGVRPSSAAAWAARVVENLETAMATDGLRQRLDAVIWRLVGEDLVHVLTGSILSSIRSTLAAEKLVLLRQRQPGVDRYELEGFNERARDRLANFILDLIEDELVELVAAAAAPKPRARKKV